MNPNDLADAFDTSSDTVIRRIVKTDDGRRILVVGTIPDKGMATVSVRMDETEIIGGEQDIWKMVEAIETVLMDMEDAKAGPPLPCICGEEHPKVADVSSEFNRFFRVECPRCGLHTQRYHWMSDALFDWQHEEYENWDEVKEKVEEFKEEHDRFQT